MANDLLRGRQTVLSLTNKSGGSVAAGDTVIIDTSNDESFTTTTASGYSTGGVGVALETIANNATGRVCSWGYVPLVTLNASGTRGHFIKTHTTAKQATSGSSIGAGTFGQLLKAGTAPPAWLFGGLPIQAGSLPSFVGARYSTAAGQSITTGGSDKIVDFGTVDFDPDTLVTTGASWKFTAPSTGKYWVSAHVLFANSAAWAAGESADLNLYKNGTKVCNLDRNDNVASSAVYKGLNGGTLVSLAAGDYIDLRVFQQSGSTIALFADGANNHVSIHKVG